MSNNNQTLVDKKCLACDSGTEPLGHEAVSIYLPQLKNTWQIIDNKKIEHIFKFSNFKEAIHFVDEVAELAEKEGHHPDIEINYNQVKIILWTHKINGLTENDFILAAKIESNLA